jgi:hypothetical protein
MKNVISVAMAVLAGSLLFSAQASDFGGPFDPEWPFPVSLGCVEEEVQVHDQATGETKQGKPQEMILLTWKHQKERGPGWQYMPAYYDSKDIEKSGAEQISAKHAHYLIYQRSFRAGLLKRKHTVLRTHGGLITVGYPSGGLASINSDRFAFDAERNHFSFQELEGDSRRESSGYCIAAADRGGVNYTNNEGEPISREETLRLGMQCEQAFEVGAASGVLTDEGAYKPTGEPENFTWQELTGDSKTRQKFMDSCASELGYRRKY